MWLVLVTLDGCGSSLLDCCGGLTLSPPLTPLGSWSTGSLDDEAWAVGSLLSVFPGCCNGGGNWTTGDTEDWDLEQGQLRL